MKSYIKFLSESSDKIKADKSLDLASYMDKEKRELKNKFLETVKLSLETYNDVSEVQLPSDPHRYEWIFTEVKFLYKGYEVVTTFSNSANSFVPKVNGIQMPRKYRKLDTLIKDLEKMIKKM